MRQKSTTVNGRHTSNGQKNIFEWKAKLTPKMGKLADQKMARAAKIDGISNPNRGTYFTRLIKLSTDWDLASIARIDEFLKTTKTSLKIKPQKRREDEDPART